jgi:hypothetical protein
VGGRGTKVAGVTWEALSRHYSNLFLSQKPNDHLSACLSYTRQINAEFEADRSVWQRYPRLRKITDIYRGSYERAKMEAHTLPSADDAKALREVEVGISMSHSLVSNYLSNNLMIPFYAISATVGVFTLFVMHRFVRSARLRRLGLEKLGELGLTEHRSLDLRGLLNLDLDERQRAGLKEFQRSGLRTHQMHPGWWAGLVAVVLSGGGFILYKGSSHKPLARLEPRVCVEGIPTERVYPQGLVLRQRVIDLPRRGEKVGPLLHVY